MHNYKKLIVILLIITIISLSSIGCWSRRELDTLAIIAGTAIDKDEEPEKIKLTTQIIKAGEIKGPETGGGGAGATSAFWNLQETGTTIFETVRKMTHSSSRKLYWPHNQVIIFGEDLAKEGIQKHIDFFIRDPETRLLVWVLVSKGKAGKIFAEKSKLEKIPAIDIDQLIKSQAATSETPEITLKEFLERLMSKTTAPIAPLIQLKEAEKTKNGYISGTAVFKKDKLVGELDATETRGLLWVIGKIKSGIILVDCPKKKCKASLEITQASSEIIPQIKNDQIQITIKIKEEGNLGSQQCPIDLTTPEAWSFLEKHQTEVIHNEIMACLKKAQELNTDIFGFGDAVHRKYPKLWKEIEDQWDEFFPTLEVNLIIETKLRRLGLITKPVTPE